MVRHLGCGLSALVVALSLGVSHARVAAQPSPATGTIEGRVTLTGSAVANTLIRMGADPACNKMNAGQRARQELTVRSADGGLANAFVHLTGTFPATPVPAEAVVLSQQGCLFRPRVLGARVGQMLEVGNQDMTLHNVHSLSTKGNTFNVSQPKPGLVQKIKLEKEEVMLRIKCDVHSWMVEWIGVVNHPYFAVTRAGGRFTISGVPAGPQTIETWHEVYGVQTQTIDVAAGATTTVEISYAGKSPQS